MSIPNDVLNSQRKLNDVTILKKFKTQTLQSEDQEINIFKTKNEPYWSISTTIPKYARQYVNMLRDGIIVVNQETGAIIELHGTLKNSSVTLNSKRELTEEQRQTLRQRLYEIRNKAN